MHPVDMESIRPTDTKGLAHGLYATTAAHLPALARSDFSLVRAGSDKPNEDPRRLAAFLLPDLSKFSELIIQALSDSSNKRPTSHEFLALFGRLKN